jgi:hypothetical protein
VFTEGTEYCLEGELQDTRSYRLSVTAVSCNGLSSIQVSKVLVRVDVEPPTVPRDPILSLIDGADRSYVLSWGPSYDNIRNGIGYYEVFGEGINGTYLIGRTTQNWINISRPLGSNDNLMVRAVDVSGLRSKMSSQVRIDNVPPVPSIDASLDEGAGIPVHLTAESSCDPDGSIVEYTWYIEGRLARNGPDLFLTLEQGTYRIILLVTDDLGTSARLDLTLESVEDADPSLGMSMRTFIDEGSVLHIIVPVDVTIHKNMTIVEDPEVERPLLSRNVLTRTMITISSIMISLLALVGFVHSLMERKERRKDAPKNVDEEFVVDDAVPGEDPALVDVRGMVSDGRIGPRTSVWPEPIDTEPFVDDVPVDEIMVLDELETMEEPDEIEWDPLEGPEYEPLDYLEEVA